MQYKCANKEEDDKGKLICGKTYSGYSKEVMGQLPEFIQNELPCLIEDQRAIDRNLLDIIEFNLVTGGSVLKQTEMYNEIKMTQYYRDSLQYYQAATECLKHDQPDQRSLFNWATQARVKPMKPYDSNKALSEVVVKNFYEERIAEGRDFRHRMLTNLTAGESISLDHTFKEVKSIATRGNNSQDLTGRLNVLNDIGQVIGYWLVESLSYDEVMEHLKRVFSFIKLSFPIVTSYLG